MLREGARCVFALQGHEGASSADFSGVRASDGFCDKEHSHLRWFVRLIAKLEFNVLTLRAVFGLKAMMRWGS